MEVMQFLTVVIIAQLFFGTGITLLTHYMPPDTLDSVQIVSNTSYDMGFSNISSQLENSVTGQLNVPVVDFGALVFYSGNIIVDLLLNSIYAVPEMIGIFINIITIIFNIDSFAVVVVQGFASVVITALYLVGIIQLIARVRSGSNIV